MAARAVPCTEFGNPILEKKAKRVLASYLKTPAFEALIKDMTRTLRKEKGVGIAAPQIGVPLAISVIEVRPTPERPDAVLIPHLVMVNPRITSYHGKPVRKWEGCLSFMKAFGKVPRYPSVTVTYQTRTGEPVTETVHGLCAHIVQHEVDHLNGIRFIDRMEDAKSLVTAAEYRRIKAKKSAR
jgi:peptide deformylase